MTKDQMQAVIDTLTLANVELTAANHGLTVSNMAHAAELRMHAAQYNMTDELHDEISDLTYELAHMTNDYYKAQHWCVQFRQQRDNARAELKEIDAKVGQSLRGVKAPSAKAEFTEGMTLEQRRAAMAAAKAAATA